METAAAVPAAAYSMRLAVDAQCMRERGELLLQRPIIARDSLMTSLSITRKTAYLQADV